MTREDLINAMPIIKAFIDGKKLQYKDLNHEWEDLEVNDLDLDDFVESAWRIKPEQKYRPFANAEECWQELLKHEPFGWVKDTEANEYLNVYCISNEASSINQFGRMLKRCVFIDGSPYGVKVEE